MVTTADVPMTVKVYSANGAALIGEIKDFTALQCLDAYNDVGSFTWQWNLATPLASSLISDTDLQVAVLMDRRDGSGFTEVARYLYEQDTYDPSMSESAQVTAQGRSMVALLERAIVYPQAGLGSLTTSWSFTGASPGAIMHDLLVAAQARGCFPGLTWSFTSGQDSSGAAWAHGFTNSFSAGTNLMQLLLSLCQGGLCEYNFTGMQLNLYNFGTFLSTDLSSSIILRRGREMVALPRGRDRTQIGTAMLAVGDSGLNVEVDASTLGSLGRFEKYMSQGGVTDSSTLTYQAQQAIAAIDDQQISYTPAYTVDTANGTPIPWKNYTAGSYISLDVQGTPVKYQVTQISTTCGPGGPTYVQPTLNDTFHNLEVLLQSKMDAITGGVITGTGQGVLPAPGPNPTVPNNPVFVPANIFTAAYFSPATGTTLAQMELNWTVPTNTDGSTMIDGMNFIIQYRLAAVPLYPIPWAQLQGKPWSTIQGNPWTNPLASPQNLQWTTVQVPIDSTSTIIQGLICSETYDFQIACTDVSGNTSVFSGISSFETAADDFAPAQPDAPVVSASMVAVQVVHDLGSASGGSFNLARDLDHLEVHFSYDPSFVPVPGVSSTTYLGKLIANAGMMSADIPAVGTFQVTSTTGIYIKVIAVDESGNTSPPSPGSGVTAVLIDDSHISSLSVSKLVAGTVTATIILGGTIETASSGQRAVMDMNGYHAYNAEGFLTFDVSPANTTIVLASGTGGNQITVDCSGLYPTFKLYDVTGTLPAFINAVEFGSQSGAGIGINTASYASTYDSSTVAQRAWLNGPSGLLVQVIDGTQAQHGGGLSVGDASISMNHQLHGALKGSFTGTWFNSIGSVQWDMLGTFAENSGNANSPIQAMFGGILRSLTGFGAAGIGYGATMAFPICIVGSVVDNTTSPTTRFYLTTASATGSGLAWNSVTVALGFYQCLSLNT